MTYWKAVILGAIYGLTELLPLSASGHLAALDHFLRLGTRSDQLLLAAFLQFGVMLAAGVTYRKELRTLLHPVKSEHHRRRKPSPAAVLQKRVRVMLAFGMIPVLAAVILSVFLDPLYEKPFFWVVMFAVSGGLMFLSARLGHGNRAEKNMTVLDAVTVGFSNMALLLPGLSQIGAGVAVGTMCGLDRRFSLKYSMLLLIPSSGLMGICLLIRAAAAGINVSQLTMCLAAMACAFAAGLASCFAMQIAVQKGKTEAFAYYCWGAGLVTLILALIS